MNEYTTNNPPKSIEFFQKSFANFDWYEFYKLQRHNESKGKINEQISSTSSSYYVSFCWFSNLKNSAINFDTENPLTNLLTEDCIFSECSNTNKGGSISFQTKGQCVQNRICSYKSKVTGKKFYGVYCSIDVSEAQPFQNKIIYSSIAESGDRKYLGFGNIYVQDGAVVISSTNESFGTSEIYPTIFLNSASSDSLFKYSTFTNNTHNPAAPGNSIFYFQKPKTSTFVQIDMKFCNVRNNSGTNNIIASSIPFIAYRCNFINNYHTAMSFQVNVTLSECYIDNYKGGATMINSFAKQRNLKLAHLSTYKCEAVYLEQEPTLINYFEFHYFIAFEIIIIIND